MWTPCGHKKKDLSLHQLLEEPWGDKNQGTSEPWKSLSQESFLMFVLYMAILDMWSTQFSTRKETEGRQPWVCDIGRFLGNWLSSLVRQCN